MCAQLEIRIPLENPEFADSTCHMTEESLAIRPTSATASKLTRTVLDLWETMSCAEMSVRLIVRTADLPTSSIYYHFGNIEHLFLVSQRLALNEARTWCDRQVAQFADIASEDLDSLGPVMAALIDEWCNQQRTLVLAWRECHLLAARNPLFIDLWQQWCALWRDTWAAICDSFGGAQHADTVACFFDSESQLNLVHWRPLLDRACLGEICIGVVNWLKGIPTTEGVWRRHARDAALQAVSRISVADEITERILNAAATVLQNKGVGELTHRTVATEAQVSVGAVSNRLRTSADIVGAAFERVYEMHIHHGVSTAQTKYPAAVLVQEGGESSGGSGRTARPGDAEAEWLAKRTSHSVLLAYDEIIVATARDPQRTGFAQQMRYLRGRWGGSVLSALIGEGQPATALDATIFSEIQSGLARTNIGLSDIEGRERIARNLAWTLNYMGQKTAINLV